MYSFMNTGYYNCKTRNFLKHTLKFLLKFLILICQKSMSAQHLPLSLSASYKKINMHFMCQSGKTCYPHLIADNDQETKESA